MSFVYNGESTPRGHGRGATSKYLALCWWRWKKISSVDLLKTIWLDGEIFAPRTISLYSYIYNTYFLVCIPCEQKKLLMMMVVFFCSAAARRAHHLLCVYCEICLLYRASLAYNSSDIRLIVCAMVCERIIYIQDFFFCTRDLVYVYIVIEIYNTFI